MIDSHCHLAALQFTDDVDAVIQRAHAAGVMTMITIGDTIDESRRCLKIAQAHQNIYATVGVHPHEASGFTIVRDVKVIEELSKDPACKAIGEIGLDYHYMHSPKDVQQRVFEAQLVLAKNLDFPAVVHTREAVEDTWTIVNHVKPSKIVLHCCTEKWSDVRRFVDAGHS